MIKQNTKCALILPYHSLESFDISRNNLDEEEYTELCGYLTRFSSSTFRIRINCNALPPPGQQTTAPHVGRVYSADCRRSNVRYLTKRYSFIAELAVEHLMQGQRSIASIYASCYAKLTHSLARRLQNETLKGVDSSCAGENKSLCFLDEHIVLCW